jgi:hypothetical protein
MSSTTTFIYIDTEWMCRLVHLSTYPPRLTVVEKVVTFTNSTIAATDVVVTAISSGATAGAYNTHVDAIAAGSCRISISNFSAGPLSEAIVLNFAVIKAVSS